jgi:hypothetical protein
VPVLPASLDRAASASASSSEWNRSDGDGDEQPAGADPPAAASTAQHGGGVDAAASKRYAALSPIVEGLETSPPSSSGLGDTGSSAAFAAAINAARAVGGDAADQGASVAMLQAHGRTPAVVRSVRTAEDRQRDDELAQRLRSLDDAILSFRSRAK